jgi:hypothetical protein
MVLKSKGRKKHRSSLSGKRKRDAMKYNHKDNYKKKKQKKIECSVCYEEIDDCSDNVVTCGKTHHPLCGECKLKCKGCPMCRSHSIKPPINQLAELSMKKDIQHEKKKRFTMEGWTTHEINGDYYLHMRSKENYPVYKNDNGFYIYYDRFKKRQNVACWVLNNKYETNASTVSAVRVGSLMGTNQWGIANGKYTFITITK